MRTIIVIPARLGSWRFPDKPLTIIEGMTMIEHVYRRSLLVENIDEVVYLTEKNVKKTYEAKILDKLGYNKLCCRRHMLTHVDIG